MEGVVLDTSIASLLHPRKRESTLLAWYQPKMADQTLILSFQTVAELWAWGVDHRWTKKDLGRLDRFLGKFLIVPYSFELAKIWADVCTHCKRRGRRLESGDGWIIATAVQHGLPLVTHDRDQLGLGVKGLEVVSALLGTGKQS